MEKETDEDLKNLFINSYLLKYCTSRIVYQKNNMGVWTIYLRYALILYNDEQQVDCIIKHYHQYNINGQQLPISVYRQNK
jgi:hypothetical protein